MASAFSCLLAPSGDPVIRVGARLEGKQTMVFRVSSSEVCRASPIFSRMLSGVSEAFQPDDGPHRMELPEDDPEAMEVI